MYILGVLFLTFGLFCCDVFAVSQDLSSQINGTWCTQPDGESFMLREGGGYGLEEDFKASKLCLTFSVAKTSPGRGTGRSYEEFSFGNLDEERKYGGVLQDGISYDVSLFSYFTTSDGSIEVHVVDMADKSHFELYLTKVDGVYDFLQGVVYEHGDSKENGWEGLSGNLKLKKVNQLKSSFAETWKRIHKLSHVKK